MMKYVVTKHCSEERMERLIQIGTTIGFGEKVLIEQYNEKTDHLERLMDNGLLLILDTKGEVLITAFPVFNLVYTTSGIFIKGNIVFFNKLGVFALNVEHIVFGIVLAGFGAVVAEVFDVFKTNLVAEVGVSKLFVNF